MVISTFAWISYTKILDTNLDLHIVAWNLEYTPTLGENNTVQFDVATLYPGMQTQIKTLTIRNNGEVTANMNYSIETLSILGTEYHADISKMSDEENCRELRKTSELVKQITGHQTAYVRPPFGNWKESMDCRISMIAVKWTIDTLDWKSKNVEEIIRKVMQQVSDHDIILMHDYYATSVEAALQIVDRLKAEGYEFVTVEDLILT